LKWGDGWIVCRTTANGEKRFFANWREPQPDGTRKKRAKQFPTQAAAEAHLRDVADRRDRDGYVAPDRLTVADLVAGYLARGAYDWGTATRAAYRQRADVHVLPDLGNGLAVDLTAPRVQHWVDRLVKRGLAPNTIDGAVRVLLGAYKEAVRLGIVPSNPVAGTKRPAIRQAPVAVWTEVEVKRVLDAVAGEPMWNAVYRLALTSGLRPGELRVVRWSDIDLDRGVLVVRRTMTKDEAGHQVVGTTTKGKRPRAIALLPAAVAALRDWRKAQLEARLAAPTWHDPDLVFATSTGRLIAQRHWQDKHDAVVASAGVPRIVPHGMRHTNATLELEAGTHPKVVADRLGHSRVEFTLNRYSHVSIDLQRAAAEALDRRLFGGDDATTSTTDEGQNR
jgi:integrase